MNSRFLPLPWRCLSCAGTGGERAQSWHLALLGAAALPSLSSALRKSKVIKSSSAAPFSIPALPTAPPDPPELGMVGIHSPADPAGTEPNPSLARNPSWNCWFWLILTSSRQDCWHKPQSWMWWWGFRDRMYKRRQDGGSELKFEEQDQGRARDWTLE